MCKKMKLENILTPYTQRINSKWIKNLNIIHRTIQILEENINSKILKISHNNIFSNISPWARETKEKKMGIHHTKKFFTAKENINKMERQSTEWKNIFTNDTSGKGLI